MSNEYQDLKSGLTIYQHGLDVCTKFEELMSYLQTDTTVDYKHPLPNWMIVHKERMLSACEMHFEDIKTYLTYHDCGKPFCLVTDQYGRRHFPNHAAISKETFLRYSNNQLIADLIGKDMLCHVTKPKDYQSIMHDEHIDILLCSALASIHANAEMFGGFDSDSFKIKFKQLDKLGERILKSDHKVLPGKASDSLYLLN